jgi:membrane protease subunit HflK
MMVAILNDDGAGMNQWQNGGNRPPNPEWERYKEQFRKDFGDPKKFIYGFIAVLLIFAGMSSYYTVGPDEEAVVIRFGKYINTTPPGLHFKLPFGIDKKYLIKTTKVHQEEFGFRTKNTHRKQRTEYSRGNYDKESLMLTGDLNVADVEWVVQYKISDPYKYLFKLRSPTQTIRDVSESIMRRVVGDKAVTEVLTIGRAEISSSAQKIMQEVLDKYDFGIYLTAVKLQDVNPPERVKSSFNEVNEAKQEQEKLINQAEESYNKIIPEAKGKGDELISRAEGFAEAMVNRARGDVAKFNSLLTEYNKAPGLTKRKMYLETMEHIFKNFKELTIVDDKIKGLLPVFQNPAKGGKE